MIIILLRLKENSLPAKCRKIHEQVMKIVGPCLLTGYAKRTVPVFFSESFPVRAGRFVLMFSAPVARP